MQQRHIFFFCSVISLISLLASPFALALDLGVLDDGRYGHRFNEIKNSRESAIFTFVGQTENLSLTVDGFDIDKDTEVNVMVNGISVGHLSVTPNNSLGPSSIPIPADMQVVGENTLEFVQRRPGWAWGITNLLLSTAEGHSEQYSLNIGVIDSGAYGHRFNGVKNRYESASFTFGGQSENLLLTLDGFDIDSDTEINVLVNGASIANLSITPNNALGPSSIPIPANVQVTGENTLEFVQQRPGWAWGVSNLLLMAPAPSSDIPQSPILSHPIEAATIAHNTTQIFQWETAANAASYQFELIKSLNGIPEPLALETLNANDCTNSICEILVLFDFQNYGPLFWRVIAINEAGNSNWAISNVTALPPIPTFPTPISPLENALIEQGSLVGFSWTPSDEASLYAVELIDTENTGLSMPKAFVPAETCLESNCSVSITLDLPIGNSYQWRVRAENDAGESAWATTAIEIIANATEVPPVPMPVSPESGTLISQNDSVDFIWTHDDHAVTYDVDFFDAVTPANIPVSVRIRADDICSNTQCVLSVPVNLPVGEYHTWHVRGRNSLGASDFSSSSFSVIETVTDIPGTFVLTSPEAGAEIQEDMQTTFTWTRSDQAASFELAFVDGTDPGVAFNSITISASACTADTCSYLATPSLPVSDLHSWQVRAINTLGNTDWVSSPLSIIAEPVELAPAPIIISPLATTQVTANQPQSFQWEQDIEAQTYEFYINDFNSGPLPVVTNLLPGDICSADVCSYTQIISLLPDTEHSWHVRARYIDNDSEWSNTALTVVPETNEADVYTIENMNVSGGGFQGDVTITDDGLTVYSSADNSGVLKSTDGGLLFKSHNEGMQSNKVASLAITPDNNQILYIGTGDKGTTGGLFRSLDGGDTWTITGDGANARFAGNHTDTDDPVPTGHPRSNGDLIVVDPGQNPSSHTDDVVIAGSYRDGVRLFSQGGESEASAVNTSGFVRSVARNAALPDIAFAAIQFNNSSLNGIYRIDYSDLSNPTSNLEFQTFRPEGLTVLNNGHVYAAIGVNGIVKFDGSSWTPQNSGLDTGNNNRQWTAVSGYVAGNEDIVYAGTNNQGGIANGANYSSIWRTEDGGDTWSALVDANSNVDDTIHGKSYDWWYRIDAFKEAGLGRRNSIVSSIEVAAGASANQVTDDIIYVSGRGGIWKSENGGNSWNPAVNNMQVTSNYGVAVNPDNAAQVVLANTDFVVLETRSGFSGNDMARDKPDDAESRAYDITFDNVSSEVITGVGHRDTNSPGGGEVYVKSAITLGAPAGSGWTNTNLSSTTEGNNGRVRAVTSGYHNGTGGSTQIVLAAVEGEGVFRYHDSTWTKSGGISLGATKRSNFVWPDSSNSGVVYLLDLSVGLYRSNDGGQSWSNIWNGINLRNNNFFNTGYIDAHDTDPTTLYVSIQGNGVSSPIGSRFRVFRMVGADTGTFDEPALDADITDITNHSGGTTIQRAGPLKMGPAGNLWLTEQQNSRNSIDAGLYVMENPATDSSFTQVTTNEYRNAAISPIGIDVSSDGYIYVSQDGGGVVKVNIPCRLHNGC